MACMKVQITLEVYDDAADPDDETGVTNEVFEEIFDALSRFGENIDIRKEGT